MKKIALVAGPALGHVGRILQAANALSLHYPDIAMDILYPEESIYPAMFAPGHITQIPLKSGRGNRLDQKASFGDLLTAQLQRNQYDLLIHDANPLNWLSLVEFPDCPRLHITNVFLVADTGVESVVERAFSRLRDDLNVRRLQRGLAELTSHYQLYEADRVLLADPRPLFKCFGELPQHYFACGSCAWSYQGELPEKLVERERLLLISMGSTGQAKLRKSVLESIKTRSGSRDLLITGKSSSKDNENRELAYEWLPLDDLLPQCNAVITQGGTGSTYQALAAGCPVFIAPSHTNHKILGQIIQRLELGVTIDRRTSPQTIESIDFDRLRTNALAYAEEVASENGANEIARLAGDLL